MSLPKDLLYTEKHEWVRIEGDVATVGITDFAQSELGDVCEFEFPEVGDDISKGESFGEIESNKAFSDVYAPVSGEIIEVNQMLADDEAWENVNEDPYGNGWLVKLRLSDSSESSGLLSPEAYQAMLDG